MQLSGSLTLFEQMGPKTNNGHYIFGISIDYRQVFKEHWTENNHCQATEQGKVGEW